LSRKIVLESIPKRQSDNPNRKIKESRKTRWKTRKEEGYTFNKTDLYIGQWE